MDAILKNLTPAQREAVTHVEGPLLVLAGPGSGKTRVVTHRIAYLVQQGVPASQIVALTFTNKAADEMARRVQQLAAGHRVWISTFHRFCARLLREFAPLVGLQANFSIYDTEASFELIKQALALSEASGKFVTPERLAAKISWAKSRLLTPHDLQEHDRDPFARITAEVYPVYQRLLLNANAVDFDDLLMHVALLLRDNPELRRALDSRYRFVLVDEYQDTNLAQYAVMRGLSIDYPNVAATGDPDQSIYSWRGADIANIVRFEEDYPQAKVVRLEENFRSTQRIVETAAHLIAHNRYRKPKSLYTKNPPGSAVRLVRYESGEEEAYDIAEQIRQKIDQGRRPGEFAVFYRTNALSRALEQAMRREGIPYQVVRGLEFYERREVKDLLAYLYLLNNPRDEWAFRRVLNVPPRGIGRQTFKKLSEFAYQKRLSLMEAARDRRFLDSLSRRLAEKLQLFTDQYQRWRKLVDKPVAEILQAIIQDIEYLNYVAALDDGPDIDRPGNVNELLSDAAEFDAQRGQGPWLEAFLERVSLVSDTDTWDSAGSKVSLMTLHAAKGLEFPVVYIIGVEEGLLPHDRSRNDEQSVEEERRLLFVGITRAQEELQLSFALRRLAHTGALPMRVPSAFLQELPLGALERVGIDAYGMSAQRAFGNEEHADDEPLDEEPPDELAWQVDEDRFAYPRQSTSTDRRPKKAGLTAGGPHENSPPMSAMPAGTAAPAVHSREASDRRFAVGDLVRHPAHGRGTIVRASGEGKRRVVKVVFDSAPDCPISFYVAYSPLEPLPPVVPPEAPDS